MNTPKIFHVHLHKTGKTYPVTVKFSKYMNNNTLAVQLIEAGGNILGTVFATISVNLPNDNLQDNTHAYIDTNNCPWAEEFLIDNNIAKPVNGIYGHSGFCIYPLYEFDLESIYKKIIIL